MTRLALIHTMIFALVGCATGSALVTGQVRTAIEDLATIQILTSMPAGAEEIAIVKASSDEGLIQQSGLDYAVEELKKQAAKIGANAVVITGSDLLREVYSVPIYNSSPIIGSSSVEIVQGVAVWIEPEKVNPYAEETDPYAW